MEKKPMLLNKLSKIQLWIGIAAVAVVASAKCETIDFEHIADGSAVAGHYTGIEFQNATVLSAGISLNEIDFPPHSGVNVATDDSGPVRIIFNNPISSFSGYFTYTTPINVEGFDAEGVEVASVKSQFDANYRSTGQAPNELLTLSSAFGITSVTLSGDPLGGSFVFDDVSFQSSDVTPPPTTVTPEPSSLILVGSSILMSMVGLNRFRNRC
jgi:hypothetical protein